MYVRCVRHSKSPIYSLTFEIIYIMTLVSQVPKLQLAINEQFLVSCELDRKWNKQGPNTHIQDAGDACWKDLSPVFSTPHQESLPKADIQGEVLKEEEFGKVIDQ